MENEEIEITEYPDPDPDADIGPWIYEKPFPRPEGGFQKYDLNNYCKDRVFCRSGYRATSCKSPIQCTKMNGGKRTKRKRKRKSRRK